MFLDYITSVWEKIHLDFFGKYSTKIQEEVFDFIDGVKKFALKCVCFPPILLITVLQMIP